LSTKFVSQKVVDAYHNREKRTREKITAGGRERNVDDKRDRERKEEVHNFFPPHTSGLNSKNVLLGSERASRGTESPPPKPPPKPPKTRKREEKGFKDFGADGAVGSKTILLISNRRKPQHQGCSEFGVMQRKRNRAGEGRTTQAFGLRRVVAGIGTSYQSIGGGGDQARSRNLRNRERKRKPDVVGV